MLYWQREMSRFESREEKSMAMFSRHNGYFEQTDWTGRAMPEEEYHELEEISPERKQDLDFAEDEEEDDEE